MPLLAVAVVSAGVLAYEVLLTRLFSIVQWHHFAYMVISIAEGRARTRQLLPVQFVPLSGRH